MIKIYDTTLRDGTQSPEVNFSVRDKLEIAKALDEFGADYIELGWPGSNPKDREVFLEAAKLKLNKACVVAFGATRRKNISASEDENLKAIIQSKAKAACIFGKTWIDHIDKQLKISAEENLVAIKDSVEFLKENRLYIFYDLEHFFDGYKDNPDYAMKCLKTASDAGADCLVLCDTNGGCLPHEISLAVRQVKDFMRTKGIKKSLGVHFHNDSGTAVANCIAAAKEGVDEIQGTINGFGERAGNADLCQVIANLALKEGIKIGVEVEKLTELSKLVYVLSNIKPFASQPYVGRNAFSHKGGIHVDAVMKGASYEHIDPNLVGNRRDIILSDLSGKANIVEVAKKHGFIVSKDDKRTEAMLKDVEVLEKRGYDIGNLKAEQFLLVNKHFGNNKGFFDIKTWKVMSEQRNGEFSECVITGSIDGKNREVVAPVEGGPVDSIFKALLKMTATNYKQIKEIKLINYKVMIAEEQGAESSVRVYIEFRNGKEEWGTVGVSPNILEASLQAIEKGFKYYLAKNC
ncbi:MAG TPA: citramalate synthase [Candidatus Nanoarchaeia archaeon]|nr:citramalate synthase [Candidatus Nanoarchaeia archaeon]